MDEPQEIWVLEWLINDGWYPRGLYATYFEAMEDMRWRDKENCRIRRYIPKEKKSDGV